MPFSLGAQDLRIEAAALLTRKGADLRARDGGGSTPKTRAAGLHGPRGGRFADRLLELGEPLGLYSALALKRPDDARRILEGDPDAAAGTHCPEALLRLVVSPIAGRIVGRTRVGPDYRRARAASEHAFDDTEAIRAAISEDLDLVDRLIARGALQYSSDDAVCHAFELPDPTVAGRLLEAGAERRPGPYSLNVLALRHAAEGSGGKESMLALLER